MKNILLVINISATRIFNVNCGSTHEVWGIGADQLLVLVPDIDDDWWEAFHDFLWGVLIFGSEKHVIIEFSNDVVNWIKRILNDRCLFALFVLIPDLDEWIWQAIVVGSREILALIDVGSYFLTLGSFWKWFFDHIVVNFVSSWNWDSWLTSITCDSALRHRHHWIMNRINRISTVHGIWSALSILSSLEHWITSF